jgi:hypothetical protein
MGGYKNIKPSENPKPFKKGQSGNPKGGSKRRRYIKELNELFIDKLGAEEGRKGEIESIVEKLIAMGLKGDLGAIKEILERIYGKVKQDLNVSGGVTLIFDKEDAKA